MDCAFDPLRYCLHVSLTREQGQTVISLNNQGIAFGLVGPKKLFDDPIYSPMVWASLTIHAKAMPDRLITLSIYSSMGLSSVLLFRPFFTPFIAGDPSGGSILSMSQYLRAHCMYSTRI